MIRAAEFHASTLVQQSVCDSVGEGGKSGRGRDGKFFFRLARFCVKVCVAPPT